MENNIPILGLFGITPENKNVRNLQERLMDLKKQLIYIDYYKYYKYLSYSDFLKRLND